MAERRLPPGALHSRPGLTGRYGKPIHYAVPVLTEDQPESDGSDPTHFGIFHDDFFLEYVGSGDIFGFIREMSAAMSLSPQELEETK